MCISYEKKTGVAATRLSVVFLISPDDYRLG
jgi:hypothetical protein